MESEKFCPLLKKKCIGGDCAWFLLKVNGGGQCAVWFLGKKQRDTL